MAKPTKPPKGSEKEHKFEESSQNDNATDESDDIQKGTFTGWLERHGQELEPGQLVLAKVLFDHIDPIDLAGDERAIALEMFKCERIPVNVRALGIVLALCGGRGGKSLIAAWRAVYLAAKLDLVLSPGEQAYVIITAPFTYLSEQVLRYCIGIAQLWFPEKGRVIEESTLGFTLVRAQSGAESNKWNDDRVRFVILPASKGGSAQRGKALVAAIVDEAAFLRGEDSVINDKAVIDAITPRLMMGGELIITTTPDCEQGEVYSLYQKNFGHAINAVVAHAPTWALRNNPRILAQVAREKERDEWNYEREFGAKFMKRNQGMFFEPDALNECII